MLKMVDASRLPLCLFVSTEVTVELTFEAAATSLAKVALSVLVCTRRLHSKQLFVTGEQHLGARNLSASHNGPISRPAGICIYQVSTGHMIMVDRLDADVY